MAKSRRDKFILRATLIYLIGGTLWIFLSDHLMAASATLHQAVWLSTVKGLLYVTITAMLLHAALKAVPTSWDDCLRPPQKTPSWATYLFAVIVTLLTLWLRMQIAADFEYRPLMILMVLPIAASAFLGGTGPGLFATAISIIGIDYMALPPTGSFALKNAFDLLQLAALVASGCIISFMSGAFMRSRQETEMALIQARTSQQAAQSAVDHLRLAQEAGQIGTWTWGLRGAAQHYWSEEIYLLCGLPNHCAPSYKIWRQTVHPDDWERVDQVIREADRQKQPYEVEWRVNLPDSDAVRWLLCRGQPVRSADGDVTSFIGIVMDITARKRAEEALQNSERTYRSLFDNMLNGLAYCRLIFDGDRACDFEYLSVNNAFETQTGLKNVVGKRVSEVIPGFIETDQELLKIYGRVAREQTSATIEYLVESLGEWFVISIYSPKPEHIVAVFDVITERKRAEEAIRASETRLRNTLEIVGVYAWDYTIASDRLRQTGPVARLFGREEDYHQKTVGDFIAAVHPDDRTRIQALVERSIQHGENFKAEYRIVFPDNSVHWHEANGDYVDSPGAEEQFLGLATDITDRKEAENRKRLQEAVFTNTQEGIVITDHQGMILAVNPAVKTITGYDDDELIGSNFRVLKSGRHDDAFYKNIFETINVFGFWQGEIWNRRKNGEIYPEWLTISAVLDQTGSLTNLIGTFTDISRMKQSEAQLEHLAHHDPLTNLPNRLLLFSRLEHATERAKRDGSKGAVLFLDLDRFKNVNDSLGHPAGDELLRLVSDRLKQRLRDSDTLARMGGDEFVVLLEAIPSPQHAGMVAQFLIDAMLEPFILSTGHKLYTGTSVGISVFPHDSHDASQVIRNADAALYVAKSAGRNTFRFYTQSLTEAANDRVEMEANIRNALQRREFILHYQPLISLETNAIIGVEALVRWNSLERGLVAPGAFIALAEETGLMLPLGEWVLRTACAQMRTWLDLGLDLETVAVNLSPLQFRQSSLAEFVHKVLTDTGLPPHYLELEITEGALMDASTDAEVQLTALKALGIRLAIDDFGTGYSSLAYLKRFPIDKLKVDQSFVRDIPDDPADMEITAAVVALGKNLHLEVLAEGIENEAQLAFLRQLGCHTGQGYLFSRPVPAAELLAFTQKKAAQQDSQNATAE